MMASAMVSGRHVLNGPRSRKRRFCMTPWPVAQAFCHNACNWYWYVSVVVRRHRKVQRKPTNTQPKVHTHTHTHRECFIYVRFFFVFIERPVRNDTSSLACQTTSLLVNQSLSTARRHANLCTVAIMAINLVRARFFFFVHFVFFRPSESWSSRLAFDPFSRRRGS